MHGYDNITEVIGQLTTRVQDVIATADLLGPRIEMAALADGSGAWYALITGWISDGGEIEYRVTAPAPANAPRWAQDAYPDFRLQTRAPGWITQNEWFELDLA